MLATLVIGLREGLEAALIVGIIAAFLRKNGRPLTGMWIGVGLAVALSIAVGVALRLVERALPQAAQEGMESIIGAVAVAFVTSMIVWMNAHSRNMKRELEAEAAEALHDSHAYALAVMAFLAVLKEGFETSVFLLATFSASTSAALAASGAVIGVVAAVAIGVGIYAGSIRLNLSLFFRITGAFLILVAAGLVITTLRTAHEAGWLNAGEQRVIDLGWLVAPGTVQSALITGVLGIPADPRLIEVVGWAAFLVPVALFVYWPARRRATGIRVAHVQWGVAVGLAAIAIGLVACYPGVPAPRTGSAQLLAGDGTDASAVGSARLVGDSLRYTVGGDTDTWRLDPATARADDHDGIAAQKWTTSLTGGDTDAPSTLTLDQLVELTGGRLPVGVNAAQNPGPFHASWSTHGTRTAWIADGVLIDAQQTVTSILTISGGGLATSRTLSLSGAAAAAYAPTAWALAPDAAQAAQQAVESAAAARAERQLWAGWVPLALAIAAAALLLAGIRSRRRALAAAVPAPAPASATSPTPTSTSPAVPATPSRSQSYAAH
ncbi:iron uptake transporter permease EfeU [Gryllotalpicola ginsengisoli]|uniref:iron uptake transporter permease EfeU n=1 Tax=Gryllotalpicola ginsengisoli TaxID=444608 RepID=UPI0003B3FFDE|nr:iron uptake transporter permease EfeU [Gryllotalpicola ginsengisoli]